MANNIEEQNPKTDEELRKEYTQNLYDHSKLRYPDEGEYVPVVSDDALQEARDMMNRKFDANDYITSYKEINPYTPSSSVTPKQENKVRGLATIADAVNTIGDIVTAGLGGIVNKRDNSMLGTTTNYLEKEKARRQAEERAYNDAMRKAVLEAERSEANTRRYADSNYSRLIRAIAEDKSRYEARKTQLENARNKWVRDMLNDDLNYQKYKETVRKNQKNESQRDTGLAQSADRNNISRKNAQTNEDALNETKWWHRNKPNKGNSSGSVPTVTIKKRPKK